MFGRAFKVASVRGVAIEMNPSWVLIVALLGWTLADDIFPSLYGGWSSAAYWSVGIGAALSLPISVVLHELSHASAAIRRGIPVKRIQLFIFGGNTEMTRQPKSPGEEFAIASAGPLTSLFIAFIASLVGFAFRDQNEVTEAIFVFILVENVAIAVFNLIPGFPLDGGRVFRAIAWRRTKSFRRATRIAAGTGEMVGYALMFTGAILLLGGLLMAGFWAGIVGWFLIGAAKAETQALQLESILGRLSARDVMREEWATVVPGASLQSIVDEHMLGAGEHTVVVANDGAVLGIISVSDIRRSPRDQWANTPAQSVMTPREKVVTVKADASAVETLLVLGGLRLNQVPVLDAGRMVGVVTRQELLDRVRLVESLAPDDPPAESPAPESNS